MCEVFATFLFEWQNLVDFCKDTEMSISISQNLTRICELILLFYLKMKYFATFCTTKNQGKIKC